MLGRLILDVGSAVRVQHSRAKALEQMRCSFQSGDERSRNQALTPWQDLTPQPKEPTGFTAGIADEAMPVH